MGKRTKKAAKRSSKKRNSRRSVSRRNAKLPKEAITLTVVLRAREGQELLLEAELRALVTLTRKEEGCLKYDLYRAADAPGALLLHEVWASREAHGAHTKTPHFLRWGARKDALLASRESMLWKQIV